MSETLLGSSISKAGMPFKFFSKKSSQSPKQPSQFVPSTPNMPIGGKPVISPVTPTLMDASFKGERRRAAVLEQQLREVSLTASKAYDTIDDLKLKNESLQEQVDQQKLLIESFNKQIEDLKNEKIQFKKLQDDEIKEKMVEKSKDHEEISNLRHEKDMMAIENESLRDEIQKLKTMYNDMSRSMTSREERDTTQDEISPSRENEYRQIINMLEDKIRELEQLLQSKTNNYEKSISTLQSSMSVLNDSKMFLNKRFHSTTEDISMYKESTEMNLTLNKDEGDTFVVTNLSFLP